MPRRGVRYDRRMAENRTPEQPAIEHPSVEHPAVSEPRLALRIMMMPRDTNHQGTVFGGIVLAHVDQAGYVEARRHGLHRWVTASVDRVDFKAPVHVGEIVEFRTRTVRLGRTSVQVQVVVDAERLDGRWARVTEALLTMVAVDGSGRSIPFRTTPPSTGGAA